MVARKRDAISAVLLFFHLKGKGKKEKKELVLNYRGREKDAVNDSFLFLATPKGPFSFKGKEGKSSKP